MKDIRFLHFFSLSAIGIAHPLQEQVAKNPEFFVVKHSGAADILLFAAILSFGIPLSLTLAVLMLGRIHASLNRPAYYAVLFLLLMIMSSTALNRVLPVQTAVHFGISILAALLVLFGYKRFDSIRSSFPYLVVAVVLVPAVFLVNSSVRKFIFPQEYERSSTRINSDIPIVMVLWDEFPLASLLDKGNRIDRKLYPNLAAFAETSYWFSNATTVSPWTNTAVCAILTGKYPGEEKLPTVYDHPENLFTALKDSYTFHVFERETRLCPTEVCNTHWKRPGLLQRMQSTLADASAIFLHIVLPLEMGGALPQISKNWSKFWEQEDDRPKEFQMFLDSIQAGHSRSLYFVHSGFPHSPWKQQPSKESHSYINETIQKSGGIRNDRINDFRAHLLQVAYVDELMGKLFHKLKQTHLFDSALIVITADHGISMMDEKIERGVTKQNYKEVMLIPLLIKLPHQKEGRIVNRNVETVDILPTIASVLNARVSGADGMSMLDHSRPERDHKRVFSEGKLMKVEPHLTLEGTLKQRFFP